MTETDGKCRGSEAVTRGVRVKVVPSFMPDQSEPEQNRYVFVYRIRVSNEGVTPVQLLSRHWEIVDADGERNIVNGEGVVGQQPSIAPGHSFEYASYCPLATPWGTMEGSYVMRWSDGDEFNAAIGRFYLVAEAPEPAESRKRAVTGS